MRRRVPAVMTLLVAGLGALTACDRGADRVRTIFMVDGMHCDACSTSIVTTLEKLEGVDEVTADHELGVTEAVYRPRKVGAEELKTEIEMLGYTVTGFETEILDG